MNYLKEKAIKSNTFCVAPWSAIYQKPNGVVAPCCIWKGDEGLGNVNEKDIEEIYTDKKATDVKLSMLSGDKLNECQACYTQEDIGIPSLRESLNNHFLDKIDFSYDRPQFMYWDLRLSNLCNFKCRICWHELSSEWYEDAKKIRPDIDFKDKVIKVNKEEFWSDMKSHYKYVEAVYFAGGEPFLNQHHYQILEDLRNLGKTDTRIIVNTNGSVTHFKKKRVLDYYKDFKDINFGFSIDGMGKTVEYIRSGINYNEWKNNLREYIDFVKDKNSRTIKYFFQITYGVMNVENVLDMFIDFAKEGFLTKHCYVNFQMIFQPIELSLGAIPDEIKNKVIHKVTSEEYINEIKAQDIYFNTDNQIDYGELIDSFKMFQSQLESVEFDQTLLQGLYEGREFTLLDKLRGESMLENIPDYRQYYK